MDDQTPIQEIAPLAVPKFECQIPEHLTKNLSENDRWLYGEISIQSQQIQWLMQQVVRENIKRRQQEMEIVALQARIQVFEDLKKTLGAKWSIVAMLVTVLLIPIALAAVGGWFYALFEHYFSKKI